MGGIFTGEGRASTFDFGKLGLITSMQLSALREASLAREMHNHGAPTQCLYMGGYVS